MLNDAQPAVEDFNRLAEPYRIATTMCVQAPEGLQRRPIPAVARR
jgi:hypothetical protein